MKGRQRVGWGVAALALALAGCATVQSRIDRNWDYYASLPPEVQEAIRAGQVEVGFTPEMVRLALGDPDRVYSRREEDGVSRTWVYSSYEGIGFRSRYGWPAPWYYHDPFYRPHYGAFSVRDTYDRFRIVFEDGRVVSIEESIA